VRSSAWTKQANEVEKTVDFLRQDTKDSRHKKISGIVVRLPEYNATPAEGFLAVSLLLAFANEMDNEHSGPLWQTAGNSLGVSDPSFLLKFYKLFFSNRNYVDCGSLGSKLLVFYPNDSGLRYAFVMNGAFGKMTVDERKRSRDMLHGDVKSSMTDYKYNEVAGILDYALLFYTKDQRWKPTALEYLKKALTLAPTELDRKKVNAVINQVNKF
jgi:hypothetical protein